MHMYGIILWTVLVYLAATNAGSLQCTEEIAKKQSELWYDRQASVDGWSSCGAKTWLSKYYELSSKPVEILLDIGCNKGYESGTFISLFKPETKVGPDTFYSIHKKEGDGLAGNLCGNCDDCKEKLTGKRKSKVKQEVFIYAFEPSFTNYRNLINLYNKVHTKLEPKGLQWRLINSAVGQTTGFTQFPRQCGVETCLVGNETTANNTGPQHEAAFITSVDSFAEAEGLPHIDIMKIDTEGHDAAAVLGAKKMFKSGKVSVLCFEYNVMGLWEKVTLQDVVKMLDIWGYDCYYEGLPTLTRLTGSCWADIYELKKWSNVVCANRDHFMGTELEKMSWLNSGDLDAEE